ncbi:MAG: hypothetical protein RLZZ292_1809 [Bacteroidota bacterium]|jgi:photosystem II stability/assembly factor-like uncharacterized protein
MLKKLNLLLCLILVGNFYAFSQGNAKENLDYLQSYKTQKAYFQQKFDEAKTPDAKRLAKKAIKQLERNKRVWAIHTNPDGTAPTRKYEYDLLKLQPNMPLSAISFGNANKGKGSAVWQAVSSALRTEPTHCPFSYSGTGRVNVVRRLNSKTYIAGTPQGGIWKTSDGGKNWMPKSDVVAESGVTDIRVHPTSPNIMFAMMGDRDGAHCSSIGVLKSKDAGETWATTGLVLSPTLFDYKFTNSNLGLNQDNPNELVVVIDKKVYYSANGGTKFDVINDNLDDINDIIFTNNFLIVSNYKGEILKSTDKGKSFEVIYSYADGLSTQDQKYTIRFNEKIINGIVYFLLPIKDGGEVLKVHQNQIISANQDNFIKPTSLNGVISDFDSQGGSYNAVLAVNPKDTNQIVVCDVNGFYSNNHGKQWAKKLDAYNAKKSGELYIHPDFHFAEFIDKNTFLIGNDGGISIISITDNAFTLEDITGNLLCSQIYYCAIAPEEGLDNVLMGLQDNGSFSKAPSVKGGAWVDVQTGDGMGQAINYNNPLIRYTQSYEGSLTKSETAFAEDCSSGTELITSKKDNPFFTKLAMHNTNPDVLFSSYDNTLYSTNAEKFDYVDKGMFVGAVSSIELYNDRLVIVGDDGQKICNYKGTSFTNIADLTKPEGITANFNSVCLTTNVEKVVYAAVSGYLAKDKVYKSSDNGKSWDNITYDLPNVAVIKIINLTARLGQYDEVLMAATNAGVYVKKGSTSTSWEQYGAALPFVQVNDLVINYVSGKIYAATYGRGLWEAELEDFGKINTATKEAESIAAQYVLYPNPTTANQVLTLKMPSSEKALTYSICNYMGSVLQQGTIAPFSTTTAIQLNEKMPAGVFLLSVHGLDRQICKKIIIK